MNCRICGSENSDYDSFCRRCGNQLAPAPQQPQQYYGPVPGMQNNGSKATASMVLGIISLFAWLLPLAGFPVSIVGLVLGIKNISSPNRGMAMAGIIMSSIGLFLTIVNAVAGAMLMLNTLRF